jgi:23S rRNA (adenine2030-N6)-methyltransferase
VLRELARKADPIHFLDTHAGAGWYGLDDPTGEWTQGIGKLTSRSARRRLPELTPYLDLVCPEDQELRDYPGSPAIAQLELREQDTLELYELDPGARQALDANLRVREDRRITTHLADGYAGLARTKVAEGTRLVALIDPPFEKVDEWDAIHHAITRAVTKRPGITILLWYPIKAGPPHEGRPEALRTSLERAKTKGLAIELLPRGGLLRPRTNVPRVRPSLSGTGLAFIGAPSRAVAKLSAALPELARSLARAEDASAWESRGFGWG